jgi:post-segregation antitoxin (ccd killing protein)
VYHVCMARVNVYLPDELAAAARDAELNMSALTQRAVTAALAARRTDAWLDQVPRSTPEASHSDVLAALDAARAELGA